MDGSDHMHIFNQDYTATYYLYGTPENAGQAHLRLHDATAEIKIKLSKNHNHTDLELMELYEKAYSTPSLNNIKGDLRYKSNIIATDVTPAEALEALKKWGVEHNQEFCTLSEQRKQKENMADNETKTEELGNCDSKN